VRVLKSVLSVPEKSRSASGSQQPCARDVRDDRRYDRGPDVCHDHDVAVNAFHEEMFAPRGTNISLPRQDCDVFADGYFRSWVPPITMQHHFLVLSDKKTFPVSFKKVTDLLVYIKSSFFPSNSSLEISPWA
jgi:hypothetical protein